MAEKLYRVFISSTFEDLKDERQQLLVHLLKTNYVPIGMELFAASGKRQFDQIKKYIDQSDYYVVILKDRYGSLAPDGKSYTEKEYDYAIKKLGPQQVLVFPSQGPIRYGDLKHGDKLEAFRKRATDECMAYFWTDAGDLKANVVHALGEAVKEDERADAGWVRASEVVAGHEDTATAEELRIALQKLDATKNERNVLRKQLSTLECDNFSLKRDLAAARAAVPLTPSLTPSSDKPLPKVGDTYRFGPYDWLVLDVQEDRALLITEDIVELRAYHEGGGPVTWAECSLQQYLNGKFLETFNAEDQKRIWSKNEDKVFLLSAGETKGYFNKDSERRAEYKGNGFWWWLRSPDGDPYGATLVDSDVGIVNLSALSTFRAAGGVRPALWLKL